VVNLRINEVTTLRMEEVQNLKDSLLVALAHHALPRITEVHGSQAERGDANAGGGRHDAVEVQEGRSLGHVTERRRHLEYVMCMGLWMRDCCKSKVEIWL
jgi:hypothetical protein